MYVYKYFNLSNLLVFWNSIKQILKCRLHVGLNIFRLLKFCRIIVLLSCPKSFFCSVNRIFFEPRIIYFNNTYRLTDGKLFYVCLGPRNSPTKQCIELYDTPCLPFLVWFYSSIYVNTTVFRKFTERLSFYHRSPKIHSELNQLISRSQQQI